MRTLANVISFLRVPFSFFVVKLSLEGNWSGAFGFILVAWFTDAIDGPIARLGNTCSSDRFFDVDGVADACLSSAMIAGLFFTRHLSWHVLIIMAVTLWPFWIGYIVAKKGTSFKKFCNGYIPIYHVAVSLFFLGGFYAYLAFPDNLSPIVIGAGLTVFVMCYLKRNRLQSWARGES